MKKVAAPSEIPEDLAPATAILASGKIPTPQLVEAAFALKKQIADAEANLAEVEAALLALGKGKHSGSVEGHVVTVVEAVAGRAGKIGYSLTVDSVKDEAPAAFLARQAKLEDEARALAGDSFKELFDRHVFYSPCEAFNVVAEKLLTPAKSRDLIALCARTGKAYAGAKAYVKYP